jgi:hypothetical protein
MVACSPPRAKPGKRLDGNEDNDDMEGDRLIEWIIRGALLAFAVAAVWTVFGDDLAQLLGR